jgi:hypothetical protein
MSLRLPLIMILSLISMHAFGGSTPTFDTIVKKDSTSAKYCAFVTESGVCLMYQQEAVSYCKSQGAHLPSTREFALLATSLGAKGIWETSGNPPSGYDLVQALNVDGTRDNFYFNFDGYDAPAGDEGINDFWSSSTDIYTSQIANVFFGDTGQIGSGITNGSVESAVRCVQGP